MILFFTEKLFEQYHISPTAQPLRDVCSTIFIGMAKQSSNQPYIVFNVLPGSNSQFMCPGNLYNFDVRFEVYSKNAQSGMNIAQELQSLYDNRYFKPSDVRIVRVRPKGPIYNRYDAGDKLYVHSFEMEYLLQETI
jgi:hypothetical protein